jgi:protein-disulfide isomerase
VLRCNIDRFRLAKSLALERAPALDVEQTLLIRRTLATALCAVAIDVLLAATTPLVRPAAAQDAIAAMVTKPGSLPDIALGSAKAPVTIIEYSSITCPHCADFEENVFPMLRSKYIDTGKVRFVSREFPIDLKAAAASMLARCIGNGDTDKYFDALTMLFKQQNPLVQQTLLTLNMVGKHFGMDEKAVEACIKDQDQLDKLSADQRFAYGELKVDATPTFFINGERVKGSISFEELEAKLAPHLKH